MSAELKNRTKTFALNIMALCGALPATTSTKHAVSQVIRSASSVAANYRAACRGRSKAEFIAKLGIAEEEADETCFWLELLIEARKPIAPILSPSPPTLPSPVICAEALREMNRLLDEASQLVAIIVASRKTARSRLER